MNKDSVVIIKTYRNWEKCETTGLQTQAKVKEIYRVAFLKSDDLYDFSHYLEDEWYNMGAFLKDKFGNSDVFKSKEVAESYAEDVYNTKRITFIDMNAQTDGVFILYGDL